MPSISLQKDKLVTEIFTTALQKDNSNPEIITTPFILGYSRTIFSLKIKFRVSSLYGNRISHKFFHFLTIWFCFPHQSNCLTGNIFILLVFILTYFSITWVDPKLIWDIKVYLVTKICRCLEFLYFSVYFYWWKYLRLRNAKYVWLA